MSGDDHADTLPVVDGPAPPPTIASYRLGHVLGAGGMGEVLLAHDLEIGREVALKRLRSATPSADAIARFVREATIQARLDHPAIVPVHALGRDADDRPFFTMKRLQGITLQDSIGHQRHPVNKHLRAFVDVCHAIQLAHERAIVHRDLKPSNIMLGDHGEVYVLDWGVARVIGESMEVPTQSGATPAGATAAGMVLGTPGYMSPEQVRGEPVDAASDVYSLGAILFEVLAGESLHGNGTAAMIGTLDAARPRSPAQRRPDANIAPELDVICVAALAFDPAGRPSARELAARVEGYLDGDRDLEQRRKLAAGHLAEARLDLATRDPSRHAAAIRAAGRAFMLDPTSSEAADLLTRLTLALPRELPPELERELAAGRLRAARERSRSAMFAYATFFAFAPLLWLIPIADPAALLAIIAAVLATVVAHFVNWRVRYVPTGVFLAVHFATCVLFSRFASPFLLVPTLIAAVMLAMTNVEWVMARRWVVLAWPLAASALPFVLEATGVFRSTWTFTAGGLNVRGDALGELSAAPIVIANVLLVVVVAFYALGINRARFVAQRAANIRAWQMRQLLPPADVDATSLLSAEV